MKPQTKLTTFYLVRHGQTDWNLQGLVQGHSDIPLNQTGEKQAGALAKLLQHVSFDLAFSSDLMRAKRTAEIVLAERKLAVKTTKLLREAMLGKIEGKSSEVFRAFDALFARLNYQEKMKFRIADDAESDEELVTRMITFLRETALAYPGKTILVGTHGAIIRIFLIHLGFATYETLPPTGIKNASYIKLASDGIDFFVEETLGVMRKEQN